MKHSPQNSPAWYWIAAPSSYEKASMRMLAHAKALASGDASEAVFITQHKSVYTAGTSAREEDLLNSAGIPTYRSGRGGQWTWHGPGQLVIWPVLDLNVRRRDVRTYIYALEGWMIDVLKCFAVTGVRREGLPGIWISRNDIGLPEKMDKILAVGVRISKWVTMHGIALNHEPDLTQYDGIIPCGVSKGGGKGHTNVNPINGAGNGSAETGGVTSLADLGLMITETELEMVIKDCFPRWFGKGAAMGRVK